MSGNWGRVCEFPDGTIMQAVTISPEGLVAVGSDNSQGDFDAAVWTSANVILAEGKKVKQQTEPTKNNNIFSTKILAEIIVFVAMARSISSRQPLLL